MEAASCRNLLAIMSRGDMIFHANVVRANDARTMGNLMIVTEEHGIMKMIYQTSTNG